MRRRLPIETVEEASRRAVDRMARRRLLRDIAATSGMLVIVLAVAGLGAWAWRWAYPVRERAPAPGAPWSLEEAAREFAELAGAIRPPAPSHPLVLLETAMLYAGYGEWDRAERLCHSVIATTRDPEEIAVARHVLLHLDASRAAGPVPSRWPWPPAAPHVGPSPPGPPPAPPAGARAQIPSVAPEPVPPPTPRAQALEVPVAGASVLAWLESALPVAVRVFATQLSAYVTSIGERSLTRAYSDRDLQVFVVQGLERRFARQVRDVTARIRPDGIAVSGTVIIGPMTLPVASRVGLTVVEATPHVALHALTIGVVEVPGLLLRLLEGRINQVIDRERLPLAVTACEFREGQVMISVEAR